MNETTLGFDNDRGLWHCHHRNPSRSSMIFWCEKNSFIGLSFKELLGFLIDLRPARPFASPQIETKGFSPEPTCTRQDSNVATA